MKHSMNRKEKELPMDTTKVILNNASYGVLCTVGSDNIPYGVPMNFIYSNDNIYFHGTIKGGYKLDNIAYNNNVSFTVVNKANVVAEKFSTDYESVIAFGVIQPVDDEEDKKEALKQLIEKYSPDFLSSGMKYIENAVQKTVVLKMEISHITGKGNREV